MQNPRPVNHWGAPINSDFLKSIQDGVQFILDITGFIDSVCPPIMQPKGGRIVAEWRVINACLLRPTSPLYANQTTCFPQLALWLAINLQCPRPFSQWGGPLLQIFSPKVPLIQLDVLQSIVEISNIIASNLHVFAIR